MSNSLNRIMGKSFLFLTLFFGITLFLNGDESPMYYDEMGIKGFESQRCHLDEFQFNVSLLYLKPTLDQSSFAITSTNNRFLGEVYPNGKRHLICTDYKPGFRLEGLYEFCSGSNSLDLRFTYFDSHDSDSVSGPFLFDTIGYPGHGAQAPEDTTYSGTARIRNHFKYYAGDATINRLAFDVCPDNLTFLFGLQYVYVGFKRNFKSRGTFLSDGVKPLNNRLHESSRFWGIGPEIGIDYNYFFELYKCFGHFAFNARARGALLCSCIRTNFHYRSERTGSVGVNLHNDRLWRVNPTIDAQLGLSYHACCCGMQTFLEVGYDFIWCNKCIDKITGYDVAFAGDTFDILETLSLQGPFVALGIAF